MAEFLDADLTGARFERVNLTGAQFHDVNFHRAEMKHADLYDVTITGFVHNVTINGVDVAPLINAELDRRMPERARMRPSDAAGCREAWATVERLWAGTVDRTRGMPPEQLHESVDGEWSFIETLRHLVFATDAWVRRAILGDPAPWHPLDLPWDQMADTPGIPRDRAVRPSLDEVLALRADRIATVREYVATLTDEALASDTTPVDGPGWPEPRSYPVRECLLTVFNEEWEHRLYAERDLDALSGRGSA